MPKVILYSGHAEVLAPLAIAFGQDIVTNRQPGSAIFLEYFSETSFSLKKNSKVTKRYVRVFYKPTASMDDSDTEIFMLPGVTD